MLITEWNGTELHRRGVTARKVEVGVVLCCAGIALAG